MRPSRPTDVAPKLIDLRSGLRHPVARRMADLVSPPIDQFLGIDFLNATHAALAHGGGPGAEGAADPTFFQRALDLLGVSVTINETDLVAIPTSGPVLVVANHPFGGVDGLILGALLTRRRPDCRLLANSLLSRIEPLRPWVIPVDPFGGTTAARRNLGPLRRSLAWLKSGGLLGTFPAGEVSSLRMDTRRIEDPSWSEATGWLARQSGATVVPVHFHGTNSALFHVAGLVHPRLRTMLLPRELREARGREIRVSIGVPIPPRRFAAYPDDAALTTFLRLHTTVLAARAERSRPRRKLPVSIPLPGRVAAGPTPEPVAPAVPPAVLASAVAALDPSRRLAFLGNLEVWWLHGNESPNLLREVGRLREITFRDVNEGTGKAIDLDRFDTWYEHLVLWDKSVHAVAGAYRLGPTTAILPRFGRKGLYTSTLFRYDGGLLRKLGPSVELGRSFIAGPWQRKAASLALLWRGIGAWLVLHPEHRRLFGPVSIDKGYDHLSRDLIIEYLRRNRGDPELSRRVSARRAPRVRLHAHDRRAVAALGGLDDVSALVSSIEPDRRGVPVLLRHYHKLNARLLAFNVDPAFQDALDGLVVVDLATIEPSTLEHYLGEEGAAIWRSRNPAISVSRSLHQNHGFDSILPS